MFKFQRIFSGNGNWTDLLFKNDEKLGVVGMDNEGVYVKTDRPLTISDVNLLIAQLESGDSSLLSKNIEFLKAN